MKKSNKFERRECDFCGETYSPNRERQRFCSSECKTRNNNREMLEGRKLLRKENI